MAQFSAADRPNEVRPGVGALTPLVSVIVPAYNVSQYIGEALESVFAQTFKDFEVIVINDGSADTADLERAIEPYLAGLTYVQQNNKGPAAARNAAIAVAAGELLALLDSDDVWYPDFLAKQVPLFEADPELTMLWCDSIQFGGGPSAGRRCMEHNPSVRPVTTEALILQQSVPLTSCTLLRRRAVLDIGGFDERFRRSEDFDLFLRLSHAGKKLDFQNVVLARRRLRAESQGSDPFRMASAAMDVLRSFAALVGESEPLAAIIRRGLDRLQSDLDLENGRMHLFAREYDRASDAYRRANEYRRQFGLAAFARALKVCPRLACSLRALRGRLRRRLR